MSVETSLRIQSCEKRDQNSVGHSAGSSARQGLLCVDWGAECTAEQQKAVLGSIPAGSTSMDLINYRLKICFKCICPEHMQIFSLVIIPKQYSISNT